MSTATVRRTTALLTGAVLAAGLSPPLTASASLPPEDRPPSPRGVALPSVDHRRGATGQTDNGLAVSARRAPRTSARRVLRLHGGDRVKIVCQRRGGRVTGKFGTSRLWDLIDIGDGRGAYVTDTYVSTGSDGRVAPRCARHAGAPPAGQPQDDGTARRGAADRVLRWARRHVSWWAGRYSMTYRLPADRSVRYMRTHEPPRGGSQGCDCSSFARWAMAQAGLDIGTYTATVWTANGRLPFTTSSARTADGRVTRGYGTVPRGGYRKGDLIFWGVTDLDREVGHVAIASGHGRIIQCSGGRGSNAGMPITSNGQPTGWIRYAKLAR